MKNIQVKVKGSISTIETLDLVDGKLLVLDALRGASYELFNTETGMAPQSITAVRIDQDLFIILDKDENGSSEDAEPDILILDYYGKDRGEEGNTDATGIVMGLAEDGKYYAYIPESSETKDAISVLASEVITQQVLGGEEISVGVFYPWWALLGLLPLAMLGEHHDDPEYPVLNDDKSTAEVGQSVVVNVLNNDTDEQNDIDPTSVKLLDKEGNKVTELTVSGEGQWVVNSTTGEVTFTPETDFTGDPKPVQYIAADKEGNKADSPATITVNYAQNTQAVADVAQESNAGNNVKNQPGDDVLTGGSGDDIFIWTAADKGSVGSPDTDTVTNFGTGNDKLDLSELLPSATEANITDYISVSGADMYINTNGGVSDVSYDLHIILTGNTSDLDTLVNNSQIII